MEENRRSLPALSDHDIDRIVSALGEELAGVLAEELEKKIATRFYRNLGRGLWEFFWRGLIFITISIAAYGAFKQMR